MPESSFEFLRAANTELYTIALRAEQYPYSDPVTSLMRSRQFIEFVAKLADPDQLSGGERKERPTLEQRIDDLRCAGIISYELSRALHEIRTEGNDAAHLNRGDPGTALEKLRQCHRAAVWFAWRSGADAASHIRTYSQPEPPTGWSGAPSGSRGRAWIIRPYPHYVDRRKEFLRNRVIAIGWWSIGNISNTDPGQVLERLKHHFKGRRHRWNSDRDTILAFRDGIKTGDLMIMAPLLMHSKNVAVGEVIGKYLYVKARASEKAGWAHQRPVRWFTEGIDRQALPDSVRANFVRATLVPTDHSALAGFCRKQGWR
jgi:hypothetical protein